MKEKLAQGLFFGCLKASIFVVNSEISFKIFLSLQRMNLTFKTSVCPTFRINFTGPIPCNGAIQNILGKSNLRNVFWGIVPIVLTVQYRTDLIRMMEPKIKFHSEV